MGTRIRDGAARCWAGSWPYFKRVFVRDLSVSQMRIDFYIRVFEIQKGKIQSALDHMIIGDHMIIRDHMIIPIFGHVRTELRRNLFLFMTVLGRQGEVAGPILPILPIALRRNMLSGDPPSILTSDK